MENKENYELVLNHISAGESRSMDEKRYELYTHTAAMWLNHQGKHLFQDEIMARYSTTKNFGEILKMKKHEFIPGMIMQRGKKREQVYYDVWGMDVIESSDPFFPFFFACKLSHIDILNLDEFLNYHLENSYDNDTEKCFRALQLIFRRYEHLLKPDTITTANEWISVKQKNQNLSGTETSTKKARVKRDSGDNITSLNLAQTAYLINLLKESRVIIKDDTILTYKTAGEAFSLLTGYSPDTLRLKTNLKGQGELTYNDRKTVREILYGIITLIDKEISEQKGKKS